ncbi:TlpA family protein disulfide reductase [Patiriisocius hiemis]|uniref:TlpA disulfide reductase family protein n=1 Tax=Patiriisocius hiemis TaxID=3075604 RepID=A0ABU2YA37_9FLAO|nr:TlpA disulfide reductase family protein [Constantimarinum sp. W242]MDT0554711.1 TlpA disulfide reductase family protein [Constantimarinum sp. W242]
MRYLKKNWLTILFLLFIALQFIPATSFPIKVFLNKLISFAPSEVLAEKREKLEDYTWELTSTDDKYTNLTSSKGNVIVINLWATWCPPCVAEMPAFQNLYDVYGENVDFYFVTNESKEVIDKFIKKNNYTFPVYISNSLPPSMLQSKSLPTTYIIDKKGSIVIEKTGAADWDNDSVKETLDSLLK